jgi:hypothetical protein
MKQKDIKFMMKDFKDIYNNRSIELGIFAGKEKRKKAINIPSETGKRGISKEQDKINNAVLLRILEGKYNILSKPFISKQSNQTTKELNKLLATKFIKTELKQEDKNIIENGVKSIFVGNILKGRTGRNNQQSTIKRKGFNKFGYDTGQLVKNFSARVKI